ncbi:transposase [Saccharopolyspora lacisalsi]|uniref:Transposase n=1 Tax=Halosaccharopolyspora lacisalsi TaxID=1000566 RepID=A0A839DXI1_9PSEU|nr:transposase [Halosaccharopolyspora lacisalsi]
MSGNWGLPPSFGMSTAHRRFQQWTEAGLWRKLHKAVLDELGGRGEIEWARAVVDAATVRTEKGIDDRARPG